MNKKILLGYVDRRCLYCGRYFRNNEDKEPGRGFCKPECTHHWFYGPPYPKNCKICENDFISKTKGRTNCYTCKPENILYTYKKHVPTQSEKIMRCVRQRLLCSLKRKSIRKNSGRWTKEILGYDMYELEAHLERQFKPGMNWSNHGLKGWHIDHIRPLCTFDIWSIKDPALKKAWALDNLQPLWWKDNLAKSKRKEDYVY